MSAQFPLDRSEPDITMGASNVDVDIHARNRIERILRLFCIVCLLRMKKAIPDGATITSGATLWQHERGGSGEQAAHQLLISIRVNGKSLEELVLQSSPLRLFILYLSAETSILDKFANEADSEIENQGGRAAVLQAIQELGAMEIGEDVDALKALLRKRWTTLKGDYVRVCQHCIFTVAETAVKERANWEKRKAFVNMPPKQIDDARRRTEAAGAKLVYLNKYLEIATALEFPLKDREIENLFEIANEEKSFNPP